MRVIQTRLSNVSDDDLYNKPAEPNPEFETITEPCKIIDENGKVLVVLAQFTGEDAQILETIRGKLLSFEKYIDSMRGSGLKNVSKVFGYQPRTPLRQRPFCYKSVLASDDAVLHKLLATRAHKISALFEEFAPQEFHEHKNKVLEKVKSDWRIEDSIYTSGIVNKSNALAYHKDRGNFPNCWSAMISLTKDIDGGLLVVPELKLQFSFPDKSVFFFDGQGLWHGVTPIRKKHLGAQRFTIVYYALKEMWKCLTKTEELKRAQIERTKTEFKKRKAQ